MTINDNFFDDLWKNFKAAKGDEAKLELFKEAMIASKLVLEENGHNSRIIYELLLELERLKDGFSQGPLNPSSPSNRPKDIKAQNKHRHAVLAVEIYMLMGHKLDEACELVGEEVKYAGETVKRWRRDKPLDFTETIELYQACLDEEHNQKERIKFLTEKLKAHLDLAKG